MKNILGIKQTIYKEFTYLISLYEDENEYGVIVSGGQKDELMHIIHTFETKDDAIECYEDLSENNLTWLFAKTLTYTFHSKNITLQDKNYLKRLVSIATLGENDEEVIVGLLSDILVKTNMDIATLHKAFPDIICDAVLAISRNPEDNETSYLKRIKSNPIAIKVKIHELVNNIKVVVTDKNIPVNQDVEAILANAKQIDELMKVVNKNEKDLFKVL